MTRGRREGARLGLLAAVLASLVLASPASADFTVNVAGDTTSLVDGTCDADGSPGNGNQCTLREALQESNATPALDTITFAASPFNGAVGTSTIAIGGSLTTSPNNYPVAIDGGDCDPAPAAARPCVGIQISSTLIALALTANGSSVRGVAFTRSGPVDPPFIDVSFIDNIAIRNSWFGVALDGTTVTGCGNGTAITIQGGTGTIVGGTSNADRNVFAGCNTGINARGEATTIQGNYFGTLPSGNLAAGTPQVTSIVLTGYIGTPASANIIGGADPGTPGVCDAPCNLIANASGSGIRIGPSSSTAADGTQVRGNFIGLGVDGSSDVGNGVGVRVDAGNANTIGGTAAAERNYFSYNGTPLETIASTANETTIRSNYFGVAPSGTSAIPNDTPTLLQGTTDRVINNRFAETLRLDSFVGYVLGNSFGIGVGGVALPISGPAIEATGSIGVIGGGADEINEIGNATTGIRLNGAANIGIDNNRIGTDLAGNPQPLTGKGILIEGGSTQNEVGSIDPALENTIVSATDDAIAIEGASTAQNSVGSNVGSSGPDPGDLFIDLGDNGPGDSSGVNGGVDPPTGTTLTSTGLSGPPVGDGEVRAFKVSTMAGDMSGFAGYQETLATFPWTVIFNPPLPSGQCVAAMYTDANSNSSELGAVQVVDAADCDVTAPTATITSGPTGLIRDATPTFGFSASEAGSTFECQLDAGSFGPCSGPGAVHTPAPLGQGTHTFRVRATDPVGNPGGPVARAFTVDTVAPNTGAISGKKKTRKRRPNFSFPAGAEPLTFRCTVDARPPVPCTSPFKAPKLRRGRRHTLKVAATDTAGNADATPSTFTFKVRRKKKRR